jgi:cysteine desulfurase
MTTVESNPVYLDAAATTPVMAEVAEFAMQLMVEEFGNAGSRTHQYGSRAKAIVEQSRIQFATALQVKPSEIIFTSGATESNNMAILGLENFGNSSGRNHIITTAIEHKAVLEPVERLAQRGFEVDIVGVDRQGRVNVEQLRGLVREDTLLVSVMAANNETGVIQPLNEIALCLPREVFFHVDGAQAFCKRTDILHNDRIDLISLSAHKFGAPKGVGALFARGVDEKRIPLTALTLGGGQERGLRPGTQPVHLIGAAGLAVEMWDKNKDKKNENLLTFKSRLKLALEPLNPVYNGDQDNCLPNIVNLSLPTVDSEALMLVVKDLISISNGSACTSHRYEPSHVLDAMGLDPDTKSSAVRLSWTPETPIPAWHEVVDRLSTLIE